MTLSAVVPGRSARRPIPGLPNAWWTAELACWLTLLAGPRTRDGACSRAPPL